MGKHAQVRGGHFRVTVPLGHLQKGGQFPCGRGRARDGVEPPHYTRCLGHKVIEQAAVLVLCTR